MKRRLLAALLAVCLVVVGLPVSAGAYGMGKAGTHQTISGANHSLAIKEDGSLWGWGHNWHGELGDGTHTSRFSPVKIMDNVVSVCAGYYHSLAIKSDGSLWAWGYNTYGQLGDGTQTNRYTPVKVMDNVAAVSAGVWHSLAIKKDGSLWAWGSNEYGNLGNGTQTSCDTPVKVMDNVTAVCAGSYHSLALKTDGSLWAWGNNLGGQLGDGTRTFRYFPVKIMNDVAEISAGDSHSFAVKTDGTLWAWGSNEQGELGDGTTVEKLNPVRIMENVVTISAAECHSLAIKADGSLWTWGRDSLKQHYDNPEKIMDNIATANTGIYHSLAIKTDGSLWAWGSNYSGQLGIGTKEDHYTPVKVMDGVRVDGGADVPVGPDKPAPSPTPGETETISLPFYSGIGNKDNEIPVAWSWDLFNKPAVTSNPYESYNNTLATTGLILSTAVEQSEGKCRSILLDKLKCTSYGYANYDSSSNLHPAVSLACKKLVVDGKEEYIFTVVVRGTSNGDDVWTDISSLWGGFDSAANNLYGQLGAFMGTTDLPDSDIPIGGDGRVKFFVTGHSLGGAMANIIAKKLSDVYGKENVFSYTFASPFVIDSGAASNTIGRGNIYNILHEEDIVPLLPPNLSNRYGLSVWFSRKDFGGMYNNFSSLTNGKPLGDRLAPTNLSPLKGHDTEIYLSFLQALSNGASLSQTNYAGGGGGGGAWCPVDLDIYMETSDGPTLVGRVRNNVVDESVTKNVVIRVKGDRKYFYFPYEGDYSIKLTGTDTDVMTFFIQDMDYSTGEPIEGTGKVFENVVLTPGKEMTAQVNVTNQTSSSTDTSNVKLYVLDAAGQPEKEVLPDGNGTEVPVTPGEAWSNPFHDVVEGAWYYEAVKFAHQNGLMSGTSTSTFAPNTRLSRAMLAQILYNKEGRPTDIDGKNFSDVAAGAWYANAVKWAESRGIAAGYGDGRFGPEDNITREQLATMLWRYAGSQQVADAPLDFRDAAKISSYAKTAMQWAVRDGIIGGKGNKTLDPKGYATRAEVAQMLMNYLSK